jgi:broad specificity phosphatase PhoE
MAKRFLSRLRANRYARDHEDSRIFVMRHGQTALDQAHRSDGWLDLPLSDDGRQSVVKTLSDHLKSVPITRIYAPDLKRNEETAHIIQSGLPDNPEVVVAPEAKTWDLGSLAGDPKKPNKPIVKNLLAHPEKSAPNGESYNDFTKRFDKWLNAREKEAKASGPLLLILSGSACRRISELTMDDRNVLDIDESGLFVLHPSGSDWTAEVINGHSDADDEAS